LKRLLTFLSKRQHEGPLYYLLCVPVLAAVAVAFAWPRLHDIRLRYEYRALRAQQINLLRKNRSLHLQREKLRSLVRIEKLAREDLGLSDPQKGQVVWVIAPALADNQGARP
jgi:cell division protein FtsL